MPVFTLYNNKLLGVNAISTAILLGLMAALISCGGGSSSNNTKPSVGQELDTFRVDTNADEDPFTVDARGFIHHPEQPSAQGLTFLRQCVSTLNTSPQCTFSDTQLVQHTTELDGRSVPSVRDVMLHTLASHQWMLDRFEFALENMPEDIRRLLGGVTAVVIGSHIRPSFYTRASGAIYIDPVYLWTTLEEKESIAKDKDFRSEFARELQFVAFSSYFHSNGDSARSPGSLNDKSVRSPESTILSLAGLLFHELAHSNDFFPPALQSDMDRSVAITRLSNALQDDWVSNQLNNNYPLQSSLWRALARVMFHGDDADDAQIALTAEEVGAEFEQDLASDDYSYSTIFEDSAMLFEEVMMRHHFGLDRIITFLEPIKNADTNQEEFWVRWGQRNRAGDERLRDRIRLLLAHYFPNTDPEPYIASLSEPDRLPEDKVFRDSLQQLYFPPASEPSRIEKSGLQSSKFDFRRDDIQSQRRMEPLL